jgi:hypothetical protein
MAGLLPTDPTFTIDCPTQLDPDRAPDGGATLRFQLLEMPIRPRGDAAGLIDVGDGTWRPDLTERVADRAVDIVARHIPDIRDAIVGRAVITPDDIAAYNPNTGPPTRTAARTTWRRATCCARYRASRDTARPSTASTNSAPAPGPVTASTAAPATSWPSTCFEPPTRTDAPGWRRRSVRPPGQIKV